MLRVDELQVKVMLTVVGHMAQMSQEPSGGLRFHDKGDIGGGKRPDHKAGTAQKGNPGAQTLRFFFIHATI
jgi:hypothetical protein